MIVSALIYNTHSCAQIILFSIIKMEKNQVKRNLVISQFAITKRSDIYTKQPSFEKSVALQKTKVKNCETKGGCQKMAANMIFILMMM